MSIYEIYCWQIFRLDQTRLGPVREHRGMVFEEFCLPEINSGLLLSVLIFFIAIEFADFTSGIKRCNKWRISVTWPILNWKDQWIFGKLLRCIGKCKVPMKTQPSVVESKPHKWKQEIDLFVNLRYSVPKIIILQGVRKWRTYRIWLKLD